MLFMNACKKCLESILEARAEGQISLGLLSVGLKLTMSEVGSYLHCCIGHTEPERPNAVKVLLIDLHVR